MQPFLLHFTYRVDPLITSSYHSTGRVIYWLYFNQHLERDRAIAERYAALTGYQLVNDIFLGAGYRDWFVKEFQRPGFTPELQPPSRTGHSNLKYFPEEWTGMRPQD
ncbi:MAG: hypothetical protein ACYDDN_09770 [Candidatus Desulforudaceae bacterium]|nr:hypothetical protein [Desulforudis sp.]MDZ7610554.1 hypothetical protein [Eubacteriales bacterium]